MTCIGNSHALKDVTFVLVFMTLAPTEFALSLGILEVVLATKEQIGEEMKVRQQSNIIGAFALMGAVAFTGAASAASAPMTHTSPAAHSLRANVAKTRKVAFKGNYSGTIAFLWSANTVSATSVTGTGTGTLLGHSTVTGTGTGGDTSTCNIFSGAGTLKGGTSIIHIKIVSSSSQQACAAGDAAPTTVSVKGVATVISGTGKFAGAKGKLAFKGSFSIQSTAAGSTESDAFTATLSGTLTVKG